jgi:hypothetical protein
MAGSLMLTLTACGHPIGQPRKDALEQDPCAGESNLIVSPALLKQDEIAQSAWMAYGLTKVAAIQGKLEGVSARRASDYDIEMKAHATLVGVWKAKRSKSSRPNPYLDTLVEIDQLGFLEEYVLMSFSEPGWTVPASALDQLDWGAFFAWARTHLHKHRPEMLAQACSRRASLRAQPPGAELPDPATLSPERYPCGQIRSQLSAARSRWNTIARSLPGEPIVLSTSASPAPSLRYVTEHRRAYPRGVSFVPTRVASLLFYDGYCAFDSNFCAVAAAALRGASRIAPFDAGVHLELVHALVNQRKLDAAGAEAELGLRYAVGNCQTGLALRKKGYVLFEQGNLLDAYRAYQKSLQYDPGSKIAVSEMLLLAQTLTRTGEAPSEIRTFVPPPSQTSKTRCTER